MNSRLSFSQSKHLFLFITLWLCNQLVVAQNATFVPANGGTNINLQYIEITFDEDVEVLSHGTYKIRDADDLNITYVEESMWYTTHPVSGNARKIRIDNGSLSATFPHGKRLTLTFEENSIYGVSSREYWNDYSHDNAGTYSFTMYSASGTGNPTLTMGGTPANEATGFSVTGNILGTFSEPVVGGEGTIYIRKYNTGEIAVEMTGARALTNNGQNLTINPTLELEPNTRYYVDIPARSFMDIHGNFYSSNTYSGNNGKTNLNFTTAGDGVAPLTSPIFDATPPTGAINVDPNGPFILPFSDNIQRNTVFTGGSFQILTRPIGSSSGFSLYYSLPKDNTSEIQLVDNKMIYTPHESRIANLENREVQIRLTDRTVLDDTGNPFGGLLSGWEFTTLDVTDPYVDTYSPANGGMAVVNTQNLELTFNEEIELGTGTIQLYKEGSVVETFAVPSSSRVTIQSGNILRIDPTASFSVDGEDYHVTITAGTIKDLNDRSYAGISDNTTWAFQAPDNIGPSITERSPANNATDAPVVLGSNWTLTFSEPIVIQPGTFYIKEFGTGNILATLSMSNISHVSSTGNVFTIRDFVLQDLPTGTHMYVDMPAGLIEDENQNDFTGLTTSTAWHFTSVTVDNTPPSITGRTPGPDATGVDINQTFTMTFDENIAVPTGLQGYIRIRNEDGSAFTNISMASVSINDGHLTVNGSQITFSRGTFAYNTTYYITIDNNAIRDENGNGMAAQSSDTWWRFTTEAAPDNTDPLLSGKSPADDNMNVAVSDNLILTFNENVKWGGGKIRLYDSKGSITDYSNSQNTSRVTISNNIVTIDPQENFEYNLDYYITIEDDAILDIAGNAYAGFSSETSWNFKTVSTGQAPTDIQISVNSFDEDTPSSTFLANVTGTDPDGNLNYFELLDMTASGTAYDDFYLSNGKLYVGYGDYDYATKSSYAIRIRAVDDHNNSFEKDFTLYVNNPNPDDIDPSITSTLPADDATGVSVDLGTYTFNCSENMAISSDPGSPASHNYYIELRAGTTGPVVKSFDVTTADVEVMGSTIKLRNIPQLSYSTQYFVRYYANTRTPLIDLAGNPLPNYNGADGGFHFTTEDLPAPLLQSKTPHNVSDVAVDASFVLQFNETVLPGPANINPGIWLKHGAASTLISLVDDAVFSGSQITITPPNDLLYGQDYYIEIPSGVIRNTIGVSYAGFTGNTEWFFTTKSEPFEPTALSPSIGTVDVPVGTDLTITFDENADIGSGSLSLYRVSDNDFIKSWSNFNGSTMTIDGKTLTFHNLADLPANTEMYVQVSDGYLRADADASNTWAGIDDNTTWRFTTGAENLAPSVQTLSPAYAESGVSLEADLVLTASENIFMTGSGNILIKQGTTTVNTIPTDDASVEVDGAVLTISGALAGLAYDTEYWVHVPGNVLTDNTGKFLPETNNGNWKFRTTKEYLEVVSFSPASSSVQPRETEFSITFDRDISLTTGSERLYIYPAGSNSAVGALSKSDFEINGTTATAVSTIWFDSDQEYYVTIDEGLFREAASSAVENPEISDETYWNFTTRVNDGNGPIPQTYSPANGATKVSRLGSEISFDITYTEPVYLGATSQNVTLYREEGASDPIYYNIGSGATLSENGKTVSFHIPSHYAMHYNKEYYILMNATTNSGKPIIFDADGNGVPGITDDQAWRFTTHETAQITSFTPAEGTTAPVNTEISFELNNDIDVMSGPVYLKYYATNGTVATINMPSTDAVADGNKVTFDFGELEEGTHYWVQIPNSSFRDEFNQTFSADDRDTWHFYTEDITKPTALTTTPEQDEVNVNLSDVIEIEWSETIIASVSAGAPITIMDATNDQVLETITSNARIDVQNGNQLRINPENDLPEQILIEVHISEGVVKDAADNVAEAYDWSFTTGDFTAPAIASLSPLHEATSVAIDADLVLTFSEEVQNGGGYIRVKEVGGSPVKVSGRIDSNPDQFTLSGNKLTIHLANANLGALAHGVGYYVQIDNSAIQDQSGNYFAGIADDATTWKFTIEKETQTINITPIADRLTTDGDFDVQATTTSNLALSYQVLSGPATNSGKTITPTGESGNVVVEVSQEGNEFYHSATETISFRITDASKDDQTITFSIADQVYGGVVPLNGSTDSGLPIAYELLSGPATRSDNQLLLTGVGTVVVRATAEGDDTYNPAEPVEVTFDVSKATLTVTAHDKSMIYGESIPDLTFGYDGFVNEDNENSLSEAPEVGTTATNTSDAGDYVITLIGGAADNYSLNLADGSLTIQKATAVVTLSDLTFNEDGTAKSPTVVTDPTDLTVVITYDGASEAPSDAGSYEVVATVDETNYSGSATATLTINEATVTDVEPMQTQISVYPNPSSDWLTISGLSEKSAQLSLIDIDGKRVLNEQVISQQRVNIASIKPGMYILQLEQKELTTTTKILIHR